MVVVTRGSLETAYASRPPQDQPATATLLVSILPRYLLPGREFSETAQSIDWVSICDVVEPDPFGAPLAITRKPYEEISRRKLYCPVPLAAQPPLPHTRIGIRSAGRVCG